MSGSQVWLITGASSGFGTELAKAALKAGHKVIATSRNPVKAAESHPEIESLGGRWLELDVTSSDTKQKVYKAIREFGRIDVIINNAGYSILGSVEDMRVIKAALPYMRSQRSGTIVNITSIAGLTGYPSSGMYAASKFALEGLSESLSQELDSFNIRLLLVEPGAFRTKFLGASLSPAAGLTKDYEGTVLEDAIKAFHAANGKQPGDPVKAADRMIEVISGTGMGAGKMHLLRLPLGPDCMKHARDKIESLSKNLDEMEAIALSTDLLQP